jgi:hypothetical protein
VRLSRIFIRLFQPFKERRLAEQRAYELLRSHLNCTQRAQFDAFGRFEVIGSDTGRRYVVRNLTAINIDEFDTDGVCTTKWCFVPSGELAQGDVLLAQKLALECFESEALLQAKAYRPSA